MMSQRGFSRRTLLRSAGLGAAASLLPWLRQTPSARANGSSIPKRILFFYTGGSMRGLWNPVAAAGQAAPTETAFELGELHQPLLAYKKSMLFLDGLDMASSELDYSPTANAHSAGATHALAAIRRAGPALPGGVSIDQLIAQRLNLPAPATAVASLDLSLDPGVSMGDGSSAFGYGELVPRLWNPSDVYRYLFPPTANVSRRQRVADAVRAEFQALSPNLASADRVKLDAHLSAVHDLEQRLALGPSATCQKPDQSSIDSLDAIYRNVNRSPVGLADAYRAIADGNIRLAVTALQCDLTRVAKLSFGILPDNVIGYTPGAYDSFDSHDLTHKIADPLSAQSQIPQAVQVIKNVHLEHAKRFAQLLQLLQAVPESDGQTLLDHTIVVWCSELAEGGHNLRGLPWIIAGGGGGTVRTRRYLKLPRVQDPNMPPPDPRLPNSAYASTVGVPHNNLFVALANAMDVPITTFGNPAACTGALAGLS
jgi:hypothetical protein